MQMQSEAVIERSHFVFACSLFTYFHYAFDEGVQNLPYCQTTSGDSKRNNKNEIRNARHSSEIIQFQNQNRMSALFEKRN